MQQQISALESSGGSLGVLSVDCVSSSHAAPSHLLDLYLPWHLLMTSVELPPWFWTHSKARCLGVLAFPRSAQPYWLVVPGWPGPTSRASVGLWSELVVGGSLRKFPMIECLFTIRRMVLMPRCGWHPCPFCHVPWRNIRHFGNIKYNREWPKSCGLPADSTSVTCPLVDVVVWSKGHETTN